MKISESWQVCILQMDQTFRFMMAVSSAVITHSNYLVPMNDFAKFQSNLIADDKLVLW